MPAPRILLAWLVLALIFSLGAAPAQGLPPGGQGGEAKIHPELLARMAAPAEGELLSVIVLAHNSLDPHQAAGSGPIPQRQERVIRALKARAGAAQQGLRAFLRGQQAAGQVGRVAPLWVINAVSLQASPAALRALAARADVARIEPDAAIPLPQPIPPANPASDAQLAAAAAGAWDNLGRINAPAVWALGFRGQGVLVASMDTGVDYTHPELAGNWRGESGGWFDPYGRYTLPADLPANCGLNHGHGTGVTSVMAGQNVGVAPEAQWMAVKVFDDDCKAYTTAVLEGFQFLLDPDGDPATADAPQVVNNSWGGRYCDTTYVFQPALQALRAAGILPVFSAGNYGPTPGSVSYPASYPEAFAVGATDGQDFVAPFSGRGPNNCVTPAAISPALVAPGVSVLTAQVGGGYRTWDGTSFAAPHAAGTLALLLSAFPAGLDLTLQEDALLNAALPLGQPSPNNSYGRGRLDALAALNRLMPVSAGFEVSTAVVSEGGSLPGDPPGAPLLIPVRLDQPAPQPVTISLQVLGGTAQRGVDYSLPASVSFAPGEQEQLVPLTITDDSVIEGDETITVRVVNPPTPSPAANTITITILDNDFGPPVEVSFGISTAEVSEDEPLFIPVRLSRPAPQPVSVSLQVLGGTAQAEVDYSLPATISFITGQQEQFVPLTILDDNAAEPAETFTLGLGNPLNATISAEQSTLTVTIQDNDPWLLHLPWVGQTP